MTERTTKMMCAGATTVFFLVLVTWTIWQVRSRRKRKGGNLRKVRHLIAKKEKDSKLSTKKQYRTSFLEGIPPSERRQNTFRQVGPSRSYSALSICIPFIPRDIKVFPRLIKSISAQTLLPNEVVVAVSSAKPGDVEAVNRILRRHLPQAVRTQIVATSEPHYAGTNRNRAADASTSSLISFVDADDELLPRRNVLVLDTFQKNPGCVCVLTRFLKPEQKSSFRPGHGLEPRLLRLSAPPTEELELLTPSFGTRRVHHGVPIVRREVMQNLKQSAERRGQDIKFLHAVVKYYGIDKILCIAEPLYIYYGNHSLSKRYRHVEDIVWKE